MAPSSFALASAPGSGDLEGLAGIINDDGAGVCYVVSSTYQAADEDEDHDEDRGDGTWTLRVGEDGKSARWWLGSWTGDALRKTTVSSLFGSEKSAHWTGESAPKILPSNVHTRNYRSMLR